MAASATCKANPDAPRRDVTRGPTFTRSLVARSRSIPRRARRVRWCALHPESSIRRRLGTPVTQHTRSPRLVSCHLRATGKFDRA